MTNKDVKLTDGIRNEAVFNQVFSNVWRIHESVQDHKMT